MGVRCRVCGGYIPSQGESGGGMKRCDCKNNINIKTYELVVVLLQIIDSLSYHGIINEEKWKELNDIIKRL